MKSVFHICRSQINVNLSKWSISNWNWTVRSSIEHRRPSISVRSLLPSTNCVTKETTSQCANNEAFRAKMRNTPTCFPILTILYLVANCSYFHVKSEEMHTTLMRGLSIRLFWNGIGEAHAAPQAEWPEWFKKYHKRLLYPSRTALPCQISTGKWKYVNPCLVFSRYIRSTYGERKTASATRMDVCT